MKSPPSFLAAAAALGAGSAAWFASLGVNSLWPFAWVVPLALLLTAPGMSVRGTAAVAAATAILGSMNLVLAYQDLPPTVLAATVLGVALHFCTVVLLWRMVARRTPALASVFAYPLILTSSEYLISHLSPHGTAGNTAYSQVDVLPLLQLASITGVWGIGFLLALVPSAIAVAWRNRRVPRTVRRVLLSAAVPLLGVLIIGVMRLRDAPSTEPVRVGLVASDDLIPHFEATTVEEVLPVVEASIHSIETLAAQGASLVVLPEKLIGIGVASSGPVHALLQDAARRTDVAILAGLNRAEPSARTNMAVFFRPGGETAVQYTKRHLVPGLEAGYVIGTSDAIVSHAGTLLGIAICKDLDFQSLGRGYARGGIGLMLVPAWDFGADAWLHSRMAIVRAVEGGYAMARTASEGRLTVSDAAGRIVAEAKSSDSGTVTLLASVRPGPAATLYTQYGDWFAWLCAAGTIVVVSAAVVRGKQAA